MQKYTNNAQDNNGNAQSGDQILVTNAATGVAAVIYSDNGITTTGNPLTADVNGMFSFYAPNGRYTVTASNSSGGSRTISDIVLFDPADSGSAAIIGATDGATPPGSLWTTVQGFINKILSSAGSSVVGFIQSYTGAVARWTQDKLRETASVSDFGAVGNGTANDTPAVMTSQVNNGIYENVLGNTYNVRQTNVQRSAGLIGTHPASKLLNTANDERVVLYGDNGSARTNNVRVEKLNISQTGTQTTDNTSSIYFTGVDNSHAIFNHVVGVLGMSSQYGSISLGPYTGNPATENQPKRQNRGIIYAFNDIDAAAMACEIFATLQSKIVGNRAYRADGSAAATSHAYRFTGYPGMPCDGNALVANTADNYATGLSVQTSAHYNNFSSFAFSNITTNGVTLNPNTTYATDHNGFNYFQGIVKTANNGFYGDNPSYDRIDMIVRYATSYGLWLNKTANYGDAQHCIADLIVKDSGGAASIETDNNILRITAADLTSNVVSISGNNNIVDVVIDGVINASGMYSLSISGNKNIVRCIAVNNSTPATADISVTGNDNCITVFAATGTSCSGARNTIEGNLGNVTSLVGATDTILRGTITSITRGGTNTDYTGLRYGSGRSQLSTTTDVNGEVTVTVSNIPTGMTAYAVFAQYLNATNPRYVTVKSVSVAANVLTFVLRFRKDDGTAAASEAIFVYYQYAAF